jgi:hypothetical protein
VASSARKSALLFGVWGGSEAGGRIDDGGSGLLYMSAMMAKHTGTARCQIELKFESVKPLSFQWHETL